MKAVILAGGIGTRMRPLTYLVPKPLLPIGGKPLLERTIEYLKGYGFDEVIVCVAYLKGQIMDYLNRRKGEIGVKLDFAESDAPLGTAGQLKTAEGFISDTFLAMNGDIFTSLNIKRLLDSHTPNTWTIALKSFNFQIPYGLVDVGENSRITSFKEKPNNQYLVNAGIYIFEPRIFDYIAPNKISNLETDVFPEAIKRGEIINAFYEEAYWADIGTVSDYERINQESLTNQRINGR